MWLSPELSEIQNSTARLSSRRVYDLEKKSRTPLKFRFPSFETCHWLGGRRLVEEMRDYGDANQRCPAHLVQAARSLATQLRSWAHDASVCVAAAGLF